MLAELGLMAFEGLHMTMTEHYLQRLFGLDPWATGDVLSHSQTHESLIGYSVPKSRKIQTYQDRLLRDTLK
jgi:hypothetical protein